MTLNQASNNLVFENLYIGGVLVQDLVIPEDVTDIPGYSFNGMTGLESVTIPESVTSVGKYAFYGCENLKEVNLPGSVTSIQSYVFGKCSSLESLTLPVGVLVINSNAFYCSDYDYTCPLKELRILGNAPLVAADAFKGVTATVYYSSNNASWTNDVFQNYGGDLTWVADDNIPGTGTENEVYIIASGSCGENVYWTLNSNGQLVVYDDLSISCPFRRSVYSVT